MTRNADFKRLVRARMQKTGESYAAARAQLVDPPAPTLDEYADLAGMADATVERRTGKTWADWVKTLDDAGCRTMDHARIAAHVGEHWPGMGDWWAQTVTVGYERIRGLREVGQLCTGDFAASKSRTYGVPVDVLFGAFGEDQRERWLDEVTVVRTASENRSVRLTWPDGTIVAAWFTDKGDKSAVAIQHSKLESDERRQLEKERWAERLDALASCLNG